MTLLTNADKLNIVNQHMKSIDFQTYNLELDLIEANAVSTPDEPVISGIENRIEDLNSKKAALAVERANLA
jgi:hypothetical protein